MIEQELVEQKRKVRPIPVRKVPPGTMEADLKERIKVFERRYEMSSEKMCQGFSLGLIRETAEIIEWLQAYHVLLRFQGQTHMDGIPGTTTEPSITAD